MRHEPSDSLSPLQPIADRRCPSCRAVKPLEDFPNVVGTRAGCCVPCRHRQAAVVRRREQLVLRQVAGRAETSYRALLAEMQAGGDDAA
jgi:hypothetical protein